MTPASGTGHAGVPAGIRLGRLTLVLVLGVLVAVAAFVLITVRYQARDLQAELNRLERWESDLLDENRRYQLQLATDTGYRLIHERAVANHGMVFPDPAQGSYLDIGRLEAHAVIRLRPQPDDGAGQQ